MKTRGQRRKERKKMRIKEKTRRQKRKCTRTKKNTRGKRRYKD